MTAPAKGFVITLAETIHDEDVERVAELLHMIKGVVAVDPVPDHGVSDHINRQRVRLEITQRIYQAVQDDD